MKAIMLAAGVGQRLYGDDDTQPPKALLRFDGKSLLHRHIDILRDSGIDEMVLVVGYRRDEILAEVDAVGASDFVRPIFNPDFRDGPIVSLWKARAVMAEGESILFMDADVLYHPSLIHRLLAAPNETCFLMDREIEMGEDPVRLCLRGGEPVDFGKMIEGAFDVVGEWPGFMRMSPYIAARVADATAVYVDRGDVAATYEEAMRDVLLSEPAGSFGIEDITGVPWIEIDFPSDLLRAERIIYPRISEADLDASAVEDTTIRDGADRKKAAGE